MYFNTLLAPTPSCRTHLHLTTTANMGTKLTQLPVELIELVVDNLPIDDLRHLRFTCRDLKEKSQRSFLAHYFNVSTFMITQDSLNMLKDFSKNQRISPCIQEVRLCLVTFTKHVKSMIDGKPHSVEERREYEALNLEDMKAAVEDQQDAIKSMKTQYEKDLKRKRRRAYGRHQSSQYAMRKKSTDVALLAEALRNLPALEAISITDIFELSSRPWGARELHLDTGVWPTTGWVHTGRYR